MDSMVSGVDSSVVGSGVDGGDSGIGRVSIVEGRTGVKGGDGEVTTAGGGGTGNYTSAGCRTQLASVATVTSERPDSPEILLTSPLPVMTSSIHGLLPCLL